MTEPQKAERDALPEKFLREHLGALQEKSFALTVDGQAHMAVLINDAKEYGQAAFEAGRSTKEQELRRAANAVLDELYNGYPGYDQNSSDVQYETVEALRSALKEQP